MVLKKTFLCSLVSKRANFLSTFSTDTAGKLDVLGHDGDTLGVDGAQVGIFKKTNQVSLRSFLESHDSARLETQVSLEVLSDLTDQPLEGQFADQKLSGLLVTTDLTESDGTGTVTVGFLDSSGGGGRFAGSLGGQLFAGSLSSGGFTGGLLGTSHVVLSVDLEGMMRRAVMLLPFIPACQLESAPKLILCITTDLFLHLLVESNKVNHNFLFKV